MPTLGDTYLSIADKLRRTDPDGVRIAMIIEMLSETNELLQEAISVEGNLPTGHRTTVRTGIPAGTWRQLYQGVPVEKSTTVQVDDTVGMLESYAQVDKALADLNGNTGAFRLSESMAFLRGLNRTMVSTMFYGDTALNPERFMGLTPRYPSLPADPSDQSVSAYNVIDMGGSKTANEQCSVWRVTWGENTSHLITPKGSMSGLKHTDQGEDRVQDPQGNYYQAYIDHFKWDVGFSLRDWRGSGRIANVDVPDLRAGTIGDELEDNMIEMHYKTEDEPGTKVWYVPLDVQVALHKRAKDKANVNLTIENFEGRPITTFLGSPIRRIDQLLLTEAVVTT